MSLSNPTYEELGLNQKSGYNAPNWNFNIDDLDPSKTYLGRGEFDREMIGRMMSDPSYGNIMGMLGGGFDPRVRNQLNNLPALQNQILGGGYFGDDQAQVFRDLISGETLKSQSGNLNRMIMDAMSGQRGAMRESLAARGLGSSGGEYANALNTMGANQQQALSDTLTQQYLNMVGAGTQGLGQMGGEQLARQQAAGGLGQWLSQFVEGAQQGRMGLAGDLYGNEMQKYLSMLGLSGQMNLGSQQAKKPSMLESLLGAGSSVAPFFL